MSEPVPVWSKTQAAALAECRRKFLIATNGDTLAGGLAAEAARLKKLKPRQLWAGAAVHDAVGDTLKTARQVQPLPAVDAAVDTVRAKLRDAFKLSKADPAAADRLFEHEYGVAVEPAVWQAQWASIEKSVRWFMGSKWLERLAALPPEAWKAVDEVVSFEVNGIKAWVKIDCAVEADGRLILIDWVTGLIRPAADFSLHVAALYAHEVWGAEPDTIDAFVVSLADGTHRRVNVDEDALMEAHMRIEAEAAALIEAAAPDPLSAPLAPDTVCRRCNYQKICRPERFAAPALANASA